MQAAERSFRDLYDNITEGVFRSTLDGRMISANPALVRLNGFNSEEEMLAAVNDIAGKWYVDPGRRAEIHQLLLKHGTVSKLVSEVYRYKTRERIWIEESTRLVRDAGTGEPLYYDGTVREVTETDPPPAAPGALRQDRLDRLGVPAPASAQAGRLILDPLCQHRALSPLRAHAGGGDRE